MIRVAILYPRDGGTFFDQDYYLDSHMALVQRKLAPFGLKKLEIENGVNEETPYYAIGSLQFSSLQEYEAGFAAVGKELIDDIPNYTDISPIVQVSGYRKLI
jgi:uncharacterized protein (TIGR02118 family)